MRRLLALTILVVFVLAASPCWSWVPHLINYQGMLTDDEGNPLNGPFDLTFRIFNVDSGGTSLWGETQSDVPVDNGLFSVILGSEDSLDLLFDEDYWLEIEVEIYGALLPRIRLTSVGYAYRAEWADTTNHTSYAQRADTADYAISADTAAYAIAGGEGDGDWTFRITDTADTTLVTGGPWGISRSGNVLYGNADSTHVNLGVVCITGTSGENYKYCTVGGGQENTASGTEATVGGGDDNTASGTEATVGGGKGNTASNQYATVGGGEENTASGFSASIGGGNNNTASNYYATVGGGGNNTASDSGATISGGNYNYANQRYATVGGGNNNTASNSYATVGGGYYNTANNNYTTVAGGDTNTASGSRATVGGGSRNLADGNYSTIGGGYENVTTGQYSTVAGGHRDTVEASHSFAGGSQVRIASGADYTFAFGRNFRTSTANAVIFHNSINPIKVGIGTTSPGVDLDIVSANPNLRLSTASGTSVITLDKASGNWGYLEFREAGASKWQAGVTSDNNYYILNWPASKYVFYANSAGNVGIGTTNPQGALDVTSTTGALIVPRMTTGQRDALTAVNGMIIYNTTTNQFNFYENGAWVTK